LFIALPGLVFAQDGAVAPAPPAGAPAGAAKPDWMSYHDHYVGEQNDIANPHRSTEEMLSLAHQMMINSLSLRPDDFNQHVTEMKKMFTDRGWGDYAGYLKESRLADMVRADQYHVNTIINGNSMVTGQGAVDGVYEWQIQAPVLMTFLQKDGGQLREINTGRFKITAVLARSLKAENPEGVLISSWKVETAAPQE
jgi:intracellular multiplication protein IcmL